MSEEIVRGLWLDLHKRLGTQDDKIALLTAELGSIKVQLAEAARLTAERDDLLKGGYLSDLKRQRDALNDKISRIERTEAKAINEACTRNQLLRINEARVTAGKRQITMSEFLAGVFEESSDAD